MGLIDLKALLTSPRPAPEWLVTDLFLRGSLIVLGGEPSTGKSIFAYTLSYAVACGLPLFSRYTTPAPTPVIYFDEENSRAELREYNHLVWRGLGSPDPNQIPLYVQSFTLGERWLARMSKLARTIKPGLIVIDTATPALDIRNENDNAEATIVVGKLRRVQELVDPRPTILIIKHERDDRDADGARKGGRRTVRGAKAWIGAADQVLYWARDSRPGADGLHRSKLIPDKTRAFGLRETLKITPAWVGEGEQRGLTLSAPGQVPPP